jgi:DNA repair protein RecO (recombination protein O)
MPLRERTIRTPALVLRHREIGEADRLLVLYTEQLGKIHAIAKGVRKLKSRKAGHLEPFTHSTLQLAKGRDLMIITQAETLNAFLPLRENLAGVGHASYVIELIDRFTYENEENPRIFHLAIRTLERLQRAKDPLLVLRFYELRLLDLLGFRPELQQCGLCQAEIKAQDQYFSAERGGVLCPNCGRSTPGARPISMEALRYLRHLQRSNFQQASVARPRPEIHTEMEILMQHYLTYLLERNLNTPSFIRKIRHLDTTDHVPPAIEND